MGEEKDLLHTPAAPLDNKETTMRGGGDIVQLVVKNRIVVVFMPAA